MPAGDLPDGGGGNPTGIVSNYSGKDWVAEIAHAAARLMLAGRQLWGKKRGRRCFVRVRWRIGAERN